MGFTANGGLVVLDEYYQKDALTPNKLTEDFLDFVKRCQSRWLISDCWCDSAEQTLINGFRMATALNRVPIGVGNALKKPINDRIRATTLLMGMGKFFVCRTCRHTIEALTEAMWDIEEINEDVRLDNGTTNIDSLDAMEYSFEREIPTLIDNWGR